MTYLDTGCLVKLYYPEPDSPQIIKLIQGKALSYTKFHELEFVNALQLKVFHQSATSVQVAAARALIQADLKTGVLVSPRNDWEDVFSEAVKLAEQYTPDIGCRSLDILHCAVAKALNVTEFITTDARQKRIAAAMGLNIPTF